MREPHEEALMSFGDHLDELRRRVFLAVAIPIPLAILVFFFASKIRAVIEYPLHAALRANGLPEQLQTRTVTELMGVDIKLSLVLGFVLSAPWVVWQVWKFVEPGLYEHERRFARLLVPGSFLLCIAGILTLYFALLPISLRVLVAYGLEARDLSKPTLVQPSEQPQTETPDSAPKSPENVAAPKWVIPTYPAMPKEVRPGETFMLEGDPQLYIVTPVGDVLRAQLSRDTAYIQQYLIGEYVDLVLLMTLGIAVAFQMPLVILLLGWVGIISGETLRAKRLHALFILTIVAAIVTPTSDIATMLLMTVPLYLLYELGLLLLIAVPPHAVREGTIVRGFFRRIRDAHSNREPRRSSGKAGAQPSPPTSQSEQAERQVSPTSSAAQTSEAHRREPDGDADEDGRSGSSS
jgi:Sec-independent protein secretion pathway component TatC